MTSENPTLPAGYLRPEGHSRMLSDPARLAALAATGLVGSAPEQTFDDLARLAASTTGCDVVAITLVGETTTYWKSVPHPPHRGGDDWQNAVGDSFCYLPVITDGPFIVDDAANDPRTAGHPAIGAWGVGAWAGFPIRTVDGQAIGTMSVIDAEPRHWTAQDLDTLAVLARAVTNEVNVRVSLAATRQALADSRELARSLQDSLLPPLLRPVPGMEAAACYLPASGDVAVVGDFYDLFHARGPWWTAVIGDVCGHGTEAAKVTALARYTLRADAGDHLSPAAVLDRLNAAMLAQRAPRFLTAAQVTLRLTGSGAAGRLCLAGHPPALIRRADGAVRPIGSYGTLLGVFADTHLSDVGFRLKPADLLLLYTDGATEARAGARGSRSERLMFDENGLTRALATTHGMTAAATIDHIADVLSEYQGGWFTDDTALLALRIPPLSRGTRPGQAAGPSSIGRLDKPRTLLE